MNGNPPREDTDLKAFLARYLRSWPLMAVSGLVLLALLVATILLVQPRFSGSTSIVIETPMRHDDPNRMVQPQEALPRTDKNYYANEQLRITGQPVVRRVVDRLGLRTKYVQEGFLLDWEVYTESPIKVELDTNSVRNLSHTPYGVAFYLHEVKGDAFTLVGDGKYGPDDRVIEVSRPARFNEWITLDSMRVRVSRAHSPLPLEGPDALQYGFIQYDPEQVTLDLMGSVLGEFSSAEATTVNVTYTGAPKAKVLDILNAIGNEYMAIHVEEQQRELDRTIATLKSEIASYTAQLDTTSDRLESFKAKANITNMDHATIMLQEELSSLDSKRESLMVQSNYYDNLMAVLRTGTEARLPSPRSSSISDPILNELTTDYTTLWSDVTMLREEGKTANPNYQRMLRLLDQKRQNILSTVQTFKQNILINLQNIDDQRKATLGKLGAVPGLTRTLADREREQRIQETVSQDLITRLSNLQVQRAALAPEVSVSTPAYLTSLEPAFPDLKILLAVAVLLTLMAPFFFLVTKALFSTKITGTGDLASTLPDVPLAARIPWSSHRDTASFLAGTASMSYIETAKLAARMEQDRTGNGPVLDLVCGAGGKESAGRMAERLAALLAQRGNRVILASANGGKDRKGGLPSSLILVNAAEFPLDQIKARGAQEGAAFILVESGNVDQVAITPQVGVADHVLVVCQPGRTTRPDLENLGLARANGQLPQVLLVLDGIKDKALPWFGLSRKRGERRLGPCRFIGYNWSRAVG
jgi:uncharacterized protein involved in exopolysaccharide biosynthesis